MLPDVAPEHREVCECVVRWICRVGIGRTAAVVRLRHVLALVGTMPDSTLAKPACAAFIALANAVALDHQKSKSAPAVASGQADASVEEDAG